MFSKKIKEGMEFTGVTFRELGELLELSPSTVSYRVNKGYKPWSIVEVLKLTHLFQSKGFNLYPEQIYADILRETDKFEDLLEYIPLSNKEIAEAIGMTSGSYGAMVRQGVTDIRHIQALKKLLETTTLFRIRARYW